MKKEIHLKVNLHNEWQHHLKGSLQQLERFIISLKFQQFFQSTQLYTLSAITLGAAVIYLLKKRTLLNLPSGPPRKWLIGNALDFPRLQTWFKFTKWRDQYKDVIYAEALGKPMVILNTLEATNDLLEKHASNFTN
ncbi:cytochrome p450 [Moniliophthora roreri MCA 2997]|uniref:Cytochrome p450 n=1 Tax=Moniliophthora roreri (strain MCA 2997) TaxID=1381753 RepID=V2WJR4_MONRO|nr:cytochrome p450 [Moniliophthora roreri MCA 2997]